MIEKKTLKNGISVTSTCFSDVSILKRSLSESKADDYVPAKWRKGEGRDFNDLNLATAIMVLKTARKGAQELSQFIQEASPSVMERCRRVNYGPWKPWESYEDLVTKRDALIAQKGTTGALNPEDEEELNRVSKEITNIDNFAQREIDKIRALPPEE